MYPNGSVRSKLMLRAALWAYERLGGVEQSITHEVWSKAELAEDEPMIERSRLNGAVVYPEFLTDDRASPWRRCALRLIGVRQS